MPVNKEFTAESYVIRDDKTVTSWRELPDAEQKRLAHAWNSAAMVEAGYIQTHRREVCPYAAEK